MFAKHLMTVSPRKPDPVYVYGNPGDYIASSVPRRIVYDTTGRIVFAKPTNGPQSVRGEGRADADGTVAMVRLNPGAGPFDPNLPSTVEIWSTDNHGPVSASDKYSIPGNLARCLVATKARTVLGSIQTSQTQVSYRFIDLASGSTYVDPTVYVPGYANPMASREAIYMQADYTADAASADPRVFLPAGNGRAARARIVPVDHSRKRFVGRYTTGGLVDVTLTPWRRPLTTDTKCRTYSWTNGVGDAIRSGKLYRRVAIFTNEIEIGSSQGVVVVNGIRFTRHTMSIFRGSTFGLVRLTLAAGAEIIPVGAAMQSGTMTMLQYLDPGDVPTNEYIIEANGSYASVNDNLLTRTSSGHPRTPACVAMNAIVVTHTDGQRLALYDLAGNFMKLTNPPGGAIPVDWTGTGPEVSIYGIDGAFFHVQSHDLIVRADGYDKIVPASFDMGETWVNTYIPSNPSNAPPAGYTPPSNAGVSTPAPVSPPPQQGNAFLIGISAWSPLFLT